MGALALGAVGIVAAEGDPDAHVEEFADQDLDVGQLGGDEEMVAMPVRSSGWACWFGVRSSGFGVRGDASSEFGSGV